MAGGKGTYELSREKVREYMKMPRVGIDKDRKAKMEEIASSFSPAVAEE
jgi:hypothetical protein